jgi:two-component system, cell cycle sensor histidine kinase and response regulator CckA
MKVLVVDDIAVNRKLLRVMLTTAGHEVVEAADGVEAMKKLRSGGFDAVISDVLMPRMDGYRLSSEIRQSPELRELPIIICSSTHLSESDQALALNAGADTFLRKPAPADVILGALTQLAASPRPQIAPHQQNIGILKEYNEELVRMLEDRNRELEAIHNRLAQDITERRRDLEALRESEERYRALFDLMPLPMFLFDPESFAILAVNIAAVEHYGYTHDELLTMTLRDIRPPEEVPALEAADWTAGGRATVGFRRHRKKDGSDIEVEIYTHRVVLEGRLCRLSVVRDVTDQRRLEEQFRQAQKMEAIGRLTSGIAHDFNNLLTPILGYSDDLVRQIGESHPLHQEVVEIAKAGERAAALTRQLLAFSRQQVLSPEVLDLNAIVRNMEKLLRRVIGEDLELVDLLDPGLGRIKADPGQVEQVIMNLAVNARDAMPAGGRLTIETRKVELDEAFASEHVDVHPGPHAMLAVSDTGTGMDAETKSRIFEPFFTTKEPGKGTGLGLSTIYGIVKQSGGTIWVYSELGHGTTFKIYLPQVEEAALATATPEVQTSLHGRETVLVAEDDDAVRLLTRFALERYGYSVLATSGGAEALQIAASHPGPIDFLLTDMLMPGMSGIELAASIRARLPGIKVLFMSGYSENFMAGNGDLPDKAVLLEKPFTAEALARKLRQVLG